MTPFYSKPEQKQRLRLDIMTQKPKWLPFPLPGSVFASSPDQTATQENKNIKTREKQNCGENKHKHNRRHFGETSSASCSSLEPSLPPACHWLLSGDISGDTKGFICLQDHLFECESLESAYAVNKTGVCPKSD